MKKAQGISINVIIIAAIALAVLVVLFMIFTGRIALFTGGVGSATSCEQQCKALGRTSLTSVEDNTKCSPIENDLPGGYEMVNGKKMHCCCSS